MRPLLIQFSHSAKHNYGVLLGQFKKNGRREFSDTSILEQVVLKMTYQDY